MPAPASQARALQGMDLVAWSHHTTISVLLLLASPNIDFSFKLTKEDAQWIHFSPITTYSEPQISIHLDNQAITAYFIYSGLNGTITIQDHKPASIPMEISGDLAKEYPQMGRFDTFHSDFGAKLGWKGK